MMCAEFSGKKEQEMKQQATKKLEITDDARAYDEKMDTLGEPWTLTLVLEREGEQVVLATLAQFKKRQEFTPVMRRKVVQAVRLAANSSTMPADRTRLSRP
jgi:hypothetical protein